jgi:hypothetical protein
LDKVLFSVLTTLVCFWNVKPLKTYPFLSHSGFLHLVIIKSHSSYSCFIFLSNSFFLSFFQFVLNWWVFKTWKFYIYYFWSFIDRISSSSISTLSMLLSLLSFIVSSCFIFFFVQSELFYDSFRSILCFYFVPNWHTFFKFLEIETDQACRLLKWFLLLLYFFFFCDFFLFFWFFLLFWNEFSLFLLNLFL